MKIIKLLFLSAILFIPLGCDEEKEDPSRTFYMGFTPFPYDISIDAIEYTYEKIREHSDIINHHFDNGVPWVESLSGADYSQHLKNDWAYRKSETPIHHKVCVSVAALNGTRNGLALYHGTADNMVLPEPWSSYTFDDGEVKTAYLSYCKRVIDFFEPDYFNMNIEANLLHFLNTDLWPGFTDFHEYVYTELKKDYPSLIIFSSITGAHLLEGYFANNDVASQRQAAQEIISFSDMYALSFYPYISSFLGNSYPEKSFEQLLMISDKPFAIAETGYPAQTFKIDADGTLVTIDADEGKQNRFLMDVLETSTKHKAEFVIWFAVRDYDQLWEEIGGHEDITIAWRDTGLFDENGAARKSLSTWRKYLDRLVRYD